MSMEKITCIAALCDSCGPAWWKGEADTLPRFPSEAEALSALAEDYAWRIEQQYGGHVLMLCHGCASKDACRLLGHNWDTVTFLDPAYFHGVSPTAEACTRCEKFRTEQDAPPAGHPDATRLEFSTEDQALLRALDWNSTSEGAV